MAVLKITKDTFASEVEGSDIPVLIDFWAAWCGPCRMLAPTVEELGAELDGKVKVAKINVDEEPELAIRFGVMSIPTLIVIKNGKVTASALGVQPKEDILSLLDK